MGHTRVYVFVVRDHGKMRNRRFSKKTKVRILGCSEHSKEELQSRIPQMLLI